MVSFKGRSLAGFWNRAGEGAPIPGEESSRRWGPRRGEERGAQGLPLGGLGSSGDGRSEALHGSRRSAAGLTAGGEVPAALEMG